MTREDCIYIWNLLEDTFENKEFYYDFFDRTDKSWYDIIINNKTTIITLWWGERYTTASACDKFCIDLVSSPDMLFHSNNGVLAATLLPIENINDIDSLVLQYQLLYDADDYYTLVLASFAYHALKQTNFSSISIFTKEILELKE